MQAPKRRIDDLVHEWYDDDETERVEIIDDVVGCAVECHGGGLGG